MPTTSFKKAGKQVLSFLLVMSVWVTSTAVAVAQANSSSAAASSTEEKKSTSLQGVLSAGSDDEAPVYIKSDSLSLDSTSRVFTYKGNVEIRKGDLTLTSDTVAGKYDEKNELQIVVCQGNVVVTRGETLRSVANKAVYRVPEATIVLTENPELMRQGNVLAADRITVFVDEDRSEAEGNVRVKVVNTEEASSEEGSEMLKKKKAEETESGTEEEVETDS